MSPSRAQLTRWKAERRAELAPLVAEVEAACDLVGWDRARPIVTAVVYGEDYPQILRRGSWRARMGKRQARKILETLGTLDSQPRLF